MAIYATILSFMAIYSRMINGLIMMNGNDV